MSKTKECLSCAIEVSEDDLVCPICGYEFPKRSSVTRWVAAALIILLLMIFLWRIL